MNFKEILLTGKELKDVLVSLPSSGPFGKMFRANSDKSVIASVAVTSAKASSQAEAHDNFNDLFFVQSGQEEFWVGGEITDKRETEPGEWIGQNLSGARKYVLRPGDMMVVPKGVAHRHGLGSVTLLIIKTP